ncbi:MAG: ATP-binding protein [Phycisphaerales bacterium]|nr:ATP-binding protein [Phycisphaerales bacterium]
MAITQGKIVRPRRTVLYGVHGIGKSTFASMAPKVVFLSTEEGANDIDTARFSWEDGTRSCAKTWDELLEAVEFLGTQDHDRKTVVLDSANWEEKLRFAKVCKDRSIPSIEDANYGKGYTFALKHLDDLLAGLDWLRDTRGMDIIIIGHAVSEMFEPPGQTAYKRYTLDTHKLSRARLFDWCDEILFANYEVFVREVNEGSAKNPKVKGIAAGDGKRMLYASERPGWIAKNRLALPDSFDLDFNVYMQHRTKGQ